MRELKFRAWDKVGKKFLIPWPEGFHILGETTCFDLIGMQLKERTPEKSTLEMLDDVIIEQFTGLTDKNGVEGYHKDICTDGQANHLIEWDKAKASFYLSPINHKGCRLTMNMLSVCWIIGNIHELLETA